MGLLGTLNQLLVSETLASVYAITPSQDIPLCDFSFLLGTDVVGEIVEVIGEDNCIKANATCYDSVASAEDISHHIHYSLFY